MLKIQLTFSYKGDNLDKQIYEMLREVESQADLHNYFIEADVREIGSDRHW